MITAGQGGGCGSAEWINTYFGINVDMTRIANPSIAPPKLIAM